LLAGCEKTCKNTWGFIAFASRLGAPCLPGASCLELPACLELLLAWSFLHTWSFKASNAQSQPPGTIWAISGDQVV